MSVLFKKPDGSFVRVAEQYAQAAQKKGYEPASEEQLEASRAPGKAAAEGVFRGATMGFLDPLVVAFQAGASGKSDAAVAEEMRLRRQENPVASTVGELGGAIGTTLATGGGASALVGGGIKGAAFEGGLYGMGSMVSESALENKPVAVESLAAGLAGGALASGGVAAGFGLVGKGVSLGLSKAGGKGLKDVLEDTAFKVEERALAEAQANAVKRLKRSGGEMRDVVTYARDKGIPIKFNAETVEQVERELQGNWRQVEKAIAPLDSVAPLTRDVDRATLVTNLSDGLRNRFKGDIVAERSVEDFIQTELAPLAERTDLKWGELHMLQRRLREKLPQGESNLKREVYDAGRKAIRDAVFSAAENNGVPQGVLMGLQKDYAKGAYLKSALETRIAKNEATGGVAGIGVMDVLRGGGFGGSVGAAALGPVGAPLGALAGAYGNKMMRERGAAITAGALRSIASSNVTPGIAKNLAAHLGGVLRVAPEVLGAYRLPLAEAAAKGADALLEEHVRLSAGPEGQHYLSTVGLPVENENEVQSAGARLAILDALDASARQSQQEIDSASDALFGSSPGRKGSIAAPMSLGNFEKSMESIRALLQSPEKAFEQVPPEMTAAAPGVASEAAAKLLQVAQFLDSKAPKNPSEGMPVSVAPQWQPSAADLDKFSQYKEAVESPGRVLKNMANGFISPEQVEAIQAVYPAIYADLQQKLGERLATWEKPLTYPQKLALSTMFGPTALGMSPQQVQVIQQSQALAVGANSGQGKPSKPDGRQDVNEAQVQTESQKLEGRA